MRNTFVPMAALRWDGHQLHTNYTRDYIKGAPNVGSGQELAPHEEQQLFSYYHISEHGSPAGTPGRQEASGRHTGPAGNEPGSQDVVRHEEELTVGKVRRPSELVRLRKTVESEPVRQDVTLQHEEVRVVREPLEPGQRAAPADIGAGEQQVVLEHEEPVVQKTAVPKERLRLEKTTSEDEVAVEEQVRKERIEFERENQDRGPQQR